MVLASEGPKPVDTEAVLRVDGLVDGGGRVQQATATARHAAQSHTLLIQADYSQRRAV